MNSSAFAVKPGSAFALKMQARVSRASAGSGSFDLIFVFVGVERSDLAPRMTVPIAAAPVVVATAQTDADGYFGVALPAQTFPAGSSCRRDSPARTPYGRRLRPHWRTTSLMKRGRSGNAVNEQQFHPKTSTRPSGAASPSPGSKEVVRSSYASNAVIR